MTTSAALRISRACALNGHPLKGAAAGRNHKVAVAELLHADVECIRSVGPTANPEVSTSYRDGKLVLKTADTLRSGPQAARLLNGAKICSSHLA